VDALLELLGANGFRYNALDSCIIRFFEAARTLNVTSIIDLVQSPQHKLMISQVDYVPTFPLLLQRSSAALVAEIDLGKTASLKAASSQAASQDSSVSRLAHIQRISDLSRQRFMAEDREFS
jgi:hypothetical protein